MNNLNIFTSGTIITDKNGKIIDYNSFADNILNEEKLSGRNIEEFQDTLSEYNPEISVLNDMKVYVISENATNNFLKMILEESYDEIFVVDKNGTCVFCNKAFEKHYGITKEKILGKHFSYVIDKGCTDKILLNTVYQTKKPITYEQETITNKTILNTSKPILDENNEILYIVENCRDITENTLLKARLSKIKQELDHNKKELMRLKKTDAKPNVIFKSKEMVSIYNTLDNLATKDVNILLLGDSGTGKTSLAKRIHDQSDRCEKNFITINCSTIPENLIESELFGYKKGAFTGASKAGKEGLVKQADGGTLFLDEIGELPYNVQSKLLELVQEKTYLPIGEVKPRYVDTRIIAATNRDLIKLVDENKFREDLYYRLAVASVTIPPLEERPDDIPLLIDYFINYFNKKYRSNKLLSKKSLQILNSYSWPGNIRQLEHLIEFLVINTQGDIIAVDDLPTNILKEPKNIRNSTQSISYKEQMELFESRIVREAYKIYNSSYKLAKALDVSQSTAHRLIKKYCS